MIGSSLFQFDSSVSSSSQVFHHTWDLTDLNLGRLTHWMFQVSSWRRFHDDRPQSKDRTTPSTLPPPSRGRFQGRGREEDGGLVTPVSGPWEKGRFQSMGGRINVTPSTQHNLGCFISLQGDFFYSGHLNTVSCLFLVKRQGEWLRILLKTVFGDSRNVQSNTKTQPQNNTLVDTATQMIDKQRPRKKEKEKGTNEPSIQKNKKKVK